MVVKVIWRHPSVPTTNQLFIILSQRYVQFSANIRVNRVALASNGGFIHFEVAHDAHHQNRGPDSLYNHGRADRLPDEVADYVIIGAGMTGKSAVGPRFGNVICIDSPTRCISGVSAHRATSG